MPFQRVASQADIPAGTIREIEIGGKTIAVANVDGKFFALSNVCLHVGGPLGQGDCSGKTLVCPWHGWEYDITTGKLLEDPGQGVETYAVEIRGSDVFVDLS